MRTDSMTKQTVIIFNCATIVTFRKHPELKTFLGEIPYHYQKHGFRQMQDGQHEILLLPHRVLEPFSYPKDGTAKVK
jgi:hypothetical protein